MAETAENKYHYLWIKHSNDTNWDYYYYSPGITKEQAQEILNRDASIVDYELTNSDNILGWNQLTSRFWAKHFKNLLTFLNT